jgi:hypothetical protein
MLEKDLKDFIGRRTTPRQIDNPSWVLHFTKKIGRISPDLPSGFLTPKVVVNSSTYDYPQRDGGKIHEFWVRLRSERVTNILDSNVRYCSARVHDLATASKGFLKENGDPIALRKLVDEYTDLIQVKPIDQNSNIAKARCLAERGKTRPVTISNLDQGLYADWIGTQLRSRMKNIPELRGSLLDDPSSLTLSADRYKKVLRPPEGFSSLLQVKWRKDQKVLYLFSGDLRAATDLLSKELVDEISADLDISPYAFYNKTLDCDGFHDVKSGTCLGLGGSWPLLSLIHFYVCRKIGLPRSSYVIKGDDIIGCWTKAQILSYEAYITRLSGMELQYKKCFIAPTRGIFCEKVFNRVKVETRVSFALDEVVEEVFLQQDQDIIPLAGLSKDLTFNSHLGAIEIISAVESLGRLKTSRKRIRSAQLSVPLIEKLGGLYPQLLHLPVKYGGLGVRPVRQYKYTRYIAAYVRAVHNCVVDVPPLVAKNNSLQTKVSKLVSKILPVKTYLSPKMDPVFERKATSALESEVASLRTSVSVIVGDSGGRFTDLKFRDLRRRLCKIHRISKDCSQVELPTLTYTKLMSLQNRLCLKRAIPLAKPGLKTRARSP